MSGRGTAARVNASNQFLARHSVHYRGPDGKGFNGAGPGNWKQGNWNPNWVASNYGNWNKNAGRNWNAWDWNSWNRNSWNSNNWNRNVWNGTAWNGNSWNRYGNWGPNWNRNWNRSFYSPLFGFYPFGLGYGVRYPWYPRYGYGLGFGWGLPFFGYNRYCGYGGWGGGFGYPSYGYYSYGYPYGYSSGYASRYAVDAPVVDAPATVVEQAPVDTAVAPEVAPVTPPASDFAAEGEQQFKSGDYAGAVKSWRHAIVDEPDNATLFLMMAQALFAVGEYDESAGALQQGLMRIPQEQWGVVVENYQELYPPNDDYSNQVKALEKSAKDTPDDPARQLLLGYQYGYLGYPVQAVAKLDRAMELAPDDQLTQALREVMAKKATADGQSVLPAPQRPATPEVTPQPAAAQPDTTRP